MRTFVLLLLAALVTGSGAGPARAASRHPREPAVVAPHPQQSVRRANIGTRSPFGLLIVQQPAPSVTMSISSHAARRARYQAMLSDPTHMAMIFQFNGAAMVAGQPAFSSMPELLPESSYEGRQGMMTFEHGEDRVLLLTLDDAMQGRELDARPEHRVRVHY